MTALQFAILFLLSHHIYTNTFSLYRRRDYNKERPQGRAKSKYSLLSSVLTEPAGLGENPRGRGGGGVSSALNLPLTSEYESDGHGSVLGCK